MEKIHGNLTDNHGRCVHYHTKLDIIANRCDLCKKLYACYQCHNEIENHDFIPVPKNQKETVMCGVCGYYFSYDEYKNVTFCPECKSQFNPKCSKHSCIYAK